jgi:hypothetical protein
MNDELWSHYYEHSAYAEEGDANNHPDREVAGACWRNTSENAAIVAQQKDGATLINLT